MFTTRLSIIISLLNYTAAAREQDPVVLDNTDITLTATPNTLIVGLTNTLAINCSIPKSEIEKLGSFTAFIITHSNDGRTNQTLASLSEHGAKTYKVDYVTVTGSITKNSVSYITVSIKEPRDTEEGVYTCFVNGVTPDARLATMSKEIKVTLDKGGNFPAECLPHMNALEDTISRLKNSCAPGSFVKTQQFGNSVYHLSSPTAYLNADDASNQCIIKEGYLVEINDLTEYTFLVQFLGGQTHYYSVLTGATDDRKEGTWMYNRIGANVRDIQWGHKQPDGDEVANCMYFWFRANWKMSDEPCIMRGGTELFGFICEVPI